MVFLINAFLNDCTYPVVYKIEVWSVGRPCLVWSPESCVTAALCSCARVVHWKVKVTSSLRDVWQQLFKQQDITVIVLCTIHFHPWLHENDTSAPAPGDADWNRNAGTCLYVHELQWHLIEIWSATSRASLIKRLISGDCFIACLTAKSKHFKHLKWCVSLWYATVMTVKAYTTAVMKKLTYVSFHKVGWEQPSGEVVNYVAVLLQIY